MKSYQVEGCGPTETTAADSPELAAELICNCHFADEHTPVQFVVEEPTPIGAAAVFAVFDRADWRIGRVVVSEVDPS